jgi:hypothetical protein
MRIRMCTRTEPRRRAHAGWTAHQSPACARCEVALPTVHMRIARQSPIGPGATAGPWRANRGLVLDPPYGRIQLAIASERPRITREIRYPTDELPHATAPPNRGFVDTIIPGTHADQVPGKINPVRALPPVHVVEL